MDDQAERLAAALADRYAIKREIGTGGMATVWLAEDLKHDRRVAVKVLKPELTAIVGSTRFLAEISTTAHLQHPHILPLFDSGEADGFLYFVMPYVEGESLRDRLDREGQLPVGDAVAIAAKVAGALGEAHAQGVVHRDIKPANILMAGAEPLIADFGIALALRRVGGRRLTETALSLGTPQYMSPEQATGDERIGPATDLYSLGCVLYEMLAGEPPHTGATLQAILGKILTGAAEPISARRRSVPAHVTAAVTKALEPVPADRFAAAGDFAAALRNPAFRHPHGPSSEVTAWRGNRALVGLLLAVSALAAWGWLRAPPRAPGQTSYLPLVTEPPVSPHPWGESVFFSPDGSTLGYNGPNRTFWIRPLSEASAVPLEALGYGQHVSFSPSSDAVALRTGARAGRIMVGSLHGGTPKPLAEGLVGGHAGIHWGADGWIYFTDTEQRLSRVQATSGAVEVLTRLNEEREEVGHVDPYAVSNGRAVMFVIRRGRLDNMDESEIAVLDLRTGSYRPLGVLGLTPKVTETGHLIYARTDGVLMAADFDATRLELQSDPIEVLSGVNVRGGNNALADYEISNDGDLLYLTDAPFGSHGLVWVTRDGDEAPAGTGREGIWGDFDISSDAARLVVEIHPHSGPQNLYSRRMPDGALTRLTFGEAIDEDPVFLNDSTVLFSSPRERGGDWDLYSRRWDGTGSSRRILDRDGGISGKSTSEDGKALVFTQLDRYGSGDLYTLWLEDDSLTAIAITRFDEAEPDLSPDGKWVAYTSNESGRTEVWVASLAEPDNRFQVTYAGGTQPRWSHDGRELYLVDSEQYLVAVGVSVAPSLRLGETERLFSVSPYDGPYRPAPDGRFLFVRPEGRAVSGEVVLIRNWRQELESKLSH